MKRLAVLALVALLSSCAVQPGRIVDAQKPGAASGSGATLTGPANSAAPSTQHAKRTTAYFPPSTNATNGAPRATPKTALPPASAPDAALSAAPASLAENGAARSGHQGAAPFSALPAIAWQVEETDTTIGQHQDAAPIVRAAAYASSWSGVKWCGLLCVFVGVLGFAYGVTHRETGYPLVFLKVAGAGVALLLVGDNPLWLLLLALPVGFYALQKFGLLRPLP